MHSPKPAQTYPRLRANHLVVIELPPTSLGIPHSHSQARQKNTGHAFQEQCNIHTMIAKYTSPAPRGTTALLL